MILPGRKLRRVGLTVPNAAGLAEDTGCVLLLHARIREQMNVSLGFGLPLEEAIRVTLTEAGRLVIEQNTVLTEA